MKVNKQIVFFSLIIFMMLLTIPGNGYGKSLQGTELDEGLDDLTRQLTKGLSSRYSMTVGVVDFRGLNGETTALGGYMAEEMITRLFIREGVRVIERVQLERALEELKFNQTDLFDPALAKKLGKFVGADAILAGTITGLDTTVRVNARLFSTERAEILAVGTSSIVRDDRVNRLLKILLQPQSFSHKETPEKERMDDHEYSGKNYTDQDDPTKSSDYGYKPYVPDSPVDWKLGERIFRSNCVVCHGQRGDGKGPAATTLNPRPKDFKRSNISRRQMTEIIRSGIRGTSMVGFGKTLSDNDIQDVAEYVYRFRDR